MQQPPSPPDPEIIAAPQSPYSPPRALAEVETIEPVSQTEPQGVAPHVSVQVSYPVKPGRAPSRDWLRWAAKVYYTTSSEQITIAKVKENPTFAGVDIKTLEAWSARDNWVELRKENAETWRKQINREIGNHIVRQKKGMLDKLDKVNELMFEKLTGMTKAGQLKITPKSFEGMATAWTRVIEKMSEMQDKVYDSVLPDMETHDPTQPTDNLPSPAKLAALLSPDAAQQMAIQMLRLQNQTGTQILPDAAPPEEEADDA